MVKNVMDLLQAYESYKKNGGMEKRKISIQSFQMMDVNLNDVEAYLRYNRNLSFNERLFLLIDRTKQKDSEIYKKALIDRRLFSKIRSNKKYNPSKKTVLALCLALELNKEEADLLLASAGYSLSKANDYDLIITFCIEKKVFDFLEINELLDHYGYELF